MRFSRKLHTSEIPVVPQDELERKAAIERSQKKLGEAMESVKRTEDVVARLNEHSSKNHYVQRIQMAYGMSHESR
jgi:hypothetical protein